MCVYVYQSLYFTDMFFAVIEQIVYIDIKLEFYSVEFYSDIHFDCIGNGMLIITNRDRIYSCDPVTGTLLTIIGPSEMGTDRICSISYLESEWSIAVADDRRHAIRKFPLPDKLCLPLEQ